MRWTYDSEVAALYVALVNGPSVRQEVLSDGTIVDYGKDGSALGFEVLSIYSGWNTDLVAQRLNLDEYQHDFLAVIVGYLLATQSPSSARLNEIEPSLAEEDEYTGGELLSA